MKKLSVLVMALVLFGWTQAASAAGDLTIFIWSEYMDPEVISEFQKKHDIKVRLDYYESNEEMIAKLQSGGLGQYDIIVPSTYAIPSLKNLNLIQPLKKDQIPNMANIDPMFTKMEADPGNEYTIPYQWGTSGLAVRHKDATQINASWNLLFKPGEELGGFIIFDTARDALASSLKYLGYSLNTTDPKQVEEAARLLVATKKRPTFLGFDGGVGGLNKVMSGIAVTAQVYSGESIRANEEDPDVHYVIPAEGSEIWTDLVAIPQKAPHLENAHIFLNYVLDAQVGARLATYNRYATPNSAAKAFIPEADLNNPVMYPSEEAINKMEYIQDLGGANRLYDEAWTMIKTQ